MAGDWANPTGVYHVGLKAAYELFPKPLQERCQQERREEWDKTHQAAVAALRAKVTAWDAEHRSPSDAEKRERKELDAQLEVLQKIESQYSDPGPVFDCVVFHDGTTWKAAGW